MSAADKTRRRFRFSSAAILFCALASGADPADEKNAQVAKKLQGVWDISQYEFFGHPEDRSIGGEMVIAGNKMQRPSGELHGTFQINATQNPMQIDVFPPKHSFGTDRLSGIFMLEDQSLKIRLSLGTRPTQIDNGGGWYFVTFERKPEKAE